MTKTNRLTLNKLINDVQEATSHYYDGNDVADLAVRLEMIYLSIIDESRKDNLSAALESFGTIELTIPLINLISFCNKNLYRRKLSRKFKHKMNVKLEDLKQDYIALVYYTLKDDDTMSELLKSI